MEIDCILIMISCKISEDQSSLYLFIQSLHLFLSLLKRRKKISQLSLLNSAYIEQTQDRSCKKNGLPVPMFGVVKKE